MPDPDTIRAIDPKWIVGGIFILIIVIWGVAGLVNAGIQHAWETARERNRAWARKQSALVEMERW